MKISKTFATVIVVFACVGVVSLSRLFFSLKLIDSHAASARAKGNPGAKIRIIEYLDFQCPACARGAIILREQMKRHPDDIYLEVRYYPITTIHEHTLKATMFAECAARQNKFWAFQDSLVSQQAYWSKSMNPTQLFRQIAVQSGVNMQKLNVCLEDSTVTKTILGEKSKGKVAGVNSTPTYFVNGKMFVGPKPLTEELGRILGTKDVE